MLISLHPRRAVYVRQIEKQKGHRQREGADLTYDAEYLLVAMREKLFGYK